MWMTRDLNMRSKPSLGKRATATNAVGFRRDGAGSGAAPALQT